MFVVVERKVHPRQSMSVDARIKRESEAEREKTETVQLAGRTGKLTRQNVVTKRVAKRL
jgi:hypothetical protein